MPRLASGADSPDDHPRLDALKQEHGDPASLLQKTKDGDGEACLAAALVSVTLRCVAADHCTADPVTKKFPASTKVSLFKRLATKLFKMPPDQMILYRKDDDGALTYLDDDSMPISYFGLEDGAVVDVADKVDD